MTLTPKLRGALIREALEGLGYCPTSFARAANMTYKALKSILDGKTTDLLSSTVEKLAALGVPRHLLSAISR